MDDLINRTKWNDNETHSKIVNLMGAGNRYDTSNSMELLKCNYKSYFTYKMQFKVKLPAYR